MLQKFNEKNRDLIVNINGRLVHRNEAGVSPFDSAVQGGDAVWEGLRVYDGRIFALLGYELVEGRMIGGRIREVERVNFAPSFASWRR